MEILIHLLRFAGESYAYKRWCSWAFASARYQFSANLLLIMWSGIEAESEQEYRKDPSKSLPMQAGKSPFTILDSAGKKETSFDKTIDLCVKACY